MKIWQLQFKRSSFSQFDSFWRNCVHRTQQWLNGYKGCMTSTLYSIILACGVCVYVCVCVNIWKRERHVCMYSQQLWVSTETEEQVKWPMAKGQRATLGADPVSSDFPKKCCCASFLRRHQPWPPLHYEPCSLERRAVRFAHYSNGVRWQVRGKSEATRLSLWPKVKFTQGFTALAAYEFARGGHVVEVLNGGAHRHVLGWDKVGYFPSVVLSSEGLRLTFWVFEWFDTSGLIQDFCSRPHISLHQWGSRGHCSSIWFWLFTGMNEGTRRGGRCGGANGAWCNM